MSLPQINLSPIYIPAAVLIYGLLHSITASLGFKDFIALFFGPGFERYYRLLYSFFATVSLLPIAALVVLIPDIQLYTIPRPIVFLTVLVQMAAVGLLVYSLTQTGAMQFIGVPQALGMKTTERLNTGGLYRFVRHPLYTFSMLALWLFPVMTRNLLLMFAAMTVYFIIGAFFEERKLLRIFGAPYAEYRAKTPFLLPCLKGMPQNQVD